MFNNFELQKYEQQHLNLNMVYIGDKEKFQHLTICRNF